MLDKLAKITYKLSPSFKKILGNIAWLFAERFLAIFVAFAIGVYVIRYLSVEQFGQLSFATSYVGLFGAIAQLGLNPIVVREIVQNEGLNLKILGTAFVLKILGSVVAMILIVTTSINFVPDPATNKLIIIISLSLIFTAFDVIEFWFQSQVLQGSTTIVRSTLLILSSLLKLAFIYLKFSVVIFAILVTVEQFVKAIGMISVYRRSKNRIFNWKLDWHIAWKLIKDSYPLILSGIMVTLYMKIDQIMLGNMASTEAVGTYAAAVKFSEIWYFIPVSICSSVFPSILKSRQKSFEEYYARLQQLFDIMAWLSIAIALPMTIISVPLITHLLGVEYRESGTILSIHIWSGIFVFLGVARSNWLTAENYTKFSFLTTAFGAITNILLNIILIPRYQGVGAAIATLISYAIASHVSCIIYPPMFKIAWMLLKATVIPFRFKQNAQYLKKVIAVVT